MRIKLTTFMVRIGAACLIVGVSCFIAGADQQQDQSKGQNIVHGIKALTDGDHEMAITHFGTALQANPKNGMAYFYLGLTYNRTGRFDWAYNNLILARKFGYKHRDMPFEMGWCLLRLGEYDKALRDLGRYELANPGRGQTSEFAGRALLALGRLDEARRGAVVDEWFVLAHVIKKAGQSPRR